MLTVETNTVTAKREENLVITQGSSKHVKDKNTVTVEYVG